MVKRKGQLNNCFEIYKVGSPEREYREALVSILEMIDFLEEEDVGFALLSVLQNSDFEIGVVNTFDHSESGSLYTHGELVACVFSKVDDRPIWWIAQYQIMSLDERCRLNPWIKFWIKSFMSNPAVSHFENYFNYKID
jgi:hypothetical protein